MNQNLEIEFKNELSKNDYLKILESEFGHLTGAKQFISQTNYYFDTLNEDLKEQGSILRVRVTDSANELTFKVPSQGFLLETNYHLSDNDVSDIIHSKEIQLSSYLSPTDTLPILRNISKTTKLYLFNQFRTKRIEKQMGDHLLVLDETVYQNELVDYELEVESIDAASGKNFMKMLLEQYKLPERKALPKIARAEQNR